MELIQSICAAARKWEDPEYGPRAEATKKSLTAENRFTELAIVFAVNQQMSLLVESSLEEWKKQLQTQHPETVSVLNPGNIPLVELQDYLAVVLSGHRYLGSTSSKNPYLLPAFLGEIRRMGGDVGATLLSQSDVLKAGARFIASGSDSVIESIRETVSGRGVAPEKCWFRGHRFSVAVLDGLEDEEGLIALAEDALMHEGMGCRSVSIIFAPRRLSVDGVLDAFGVHRSMFPAHEATIGSIKLQQAFLAALKSPHAYPEDFQFLISRGDPEEKGPGHIRWVPYSSIQEATDWITANKHRIQGVFSDERLLMKNANWEMIGNAQRPSLRWHPDGRSHESFLQF